MELVNWVEHVLKECWCSCLVCSSHELNMLSTSWIVVNFECAGFLYSLEFNVKISIYMNIAHASNHLNLYKENQTYLNFSQENQTYFGVCEYLVVLDVKNIKSEVVLLSSTHLNHHLISIISYHHLCWVWLTKFEVHNRLLLILIRSRTEKRKLQCFL